MCFPEPDATKAANLAQMFDVDAERAHSALSLRRSGSDFYAAGRLLASEQRQAMEAKTQAAVAEAVVEAWRRDRGILIR